MALMKSFALSLTLTLIATTSSAQAQHDEVALRARALRLMSETPLIDGHNDLPWQYRQRVHNHIADLDISQDLSGLERPTHTDIPRLQAGKLGAQFWSVYIPIRESGGSADDVLTVIEQIDVVKRMVDRYPGQFEMAYTAAEIERIFSSGKVASMIGMEGGHSIGNSLATLRATYELGARYMTITHSLNTDWADSCTDDAVHGGLTKFGREVIGEMNRLGMLVDLSHVSPATMHDVLDVAVAPVIFSHSSARAVCDHPRNVPDDILRRVKASGGVVMVTFVPSFINQAVADDAEKAKEARLGFAEEHPDDEDGIQESMRIWRESNPAPKATLSDVADHFDHIRQVAGIDHLGIGGDFDGIRSTPVGLEDVSKYPNLIVELLRRGYSDEDIQKLLGQNLLRVMREVEGVAQRLQLERPASDALIEELDSAD